MPKLIDNILLEQYNNIIDSNINEDYILNSIYNVLSNGIPLHEDLDLTDDDFVVNEASVAGRKFYDSILSKTANKDEIFDVVIPIELLTDRQRKKARQVDVSFPVTIDEARLDSYIMEFKDAKEKDYELYKKYMKWSNWYSDFHDLIYDSLPETDANLFLAAIAFASANTTLDVNIFEAAKLYKTVSADWKTSNATRNALLFVANNINSIDSQVDIDMLTRLANSKCQYAKMLMPKIDDTDSKKTIVREITVSKAKLANYNNFIKYFAKRNGKLTKSQIMNDLRNGKLLIGGSKIYSFFINLIDPDYEWILVDGAENAAIQPTTIDRWMIKIFFTDPLRRLVSELQKNGIITNDDKTADVFISSAIMYLFKQDRVRSHIVKIMNDKLREHKLDMKSHQLQAFGWAKIRQDYRIPSAQFESYVDVVNFVGAISDKIEQINPELNFINKYGTDIKKETKSVLSTINLLSKLHRFNFKNEKEINRTIQNWKKFTPDLSMNKPKTKLTIKGGQSKTKNKFLLSPKQTKPGIWSVDIKHKGKILSTIRGTSKSEAIQNAKIWIDQHKSFVKK